MRRSGAEPKGVVPNGRRLQGTRSKASRFLKPKAGRKGIPRTPGSTRGASPEVRIVKSWDLEEIASLHAEAGWYSAEDGSLEAIAGKVSGSLAFAVVVDASSGRAIGSGRLISDGAVDGYIQELVVTASRRGEGIGLRILDALLTEAEERGLSWVGAVGEPGTEEFYRRTGMKRKEGFTLYLWER